MSQPGPLMEQCRICGSYLKSGLPGWPQLLLPGDIPARSEVCDPCAAKCGPLPDEPYTPPRARRTAPMSQPAKPPPPPIEWTAREEPPRNLWQAAKDVLRFVFRGEGTIP